MVDLGAREKEVACADRSLCQAKYHASLGRPAYLPVGPLLEDVEIARGLSRKVSKYLKREWRSRWWPTSQSGHAVDDQGSRSSVDDVDDVDDDP